MEQDKGVVIRSHLIDRRNRLREAISNNQGSADLEKLLLEVDAALERMNTGSYGICEVCNEPVEDEYLRIDPLARVCFAHLSSLEQQAIERDLELASQIQNNLLPTQDVTLPGWEISFHYEAAGPVSGDYCDLLKSVNKTEDSFFFVGDVSGKGVAASLLMSQLHAIFRTLAISDLSLDRMVERANRIFCESILSTHFATLVSGKLNRTGVVEICNAGHCPPLLVRAGQATPIESEGLPLGMFCNGQYGAKTFKLSKGDILFLYTDGLTESRNPYDSQYGEDRLSRIIKDQHSIPPRDLINACLRDLFDFRAGAARVDDLTMMVLRCMGE